MNWMLALPELALIVSAMLILLIGVLQSKDAMVSCTVLALAASGGIFYLLAKDPGGVAFGGLFIVDRFSAFSKILILAGSACSLILALDYTKKENLRRFEMPVLMLLSTAGMMVMVSASSMLTMYMGIELQSLAIYVLAAFARDELRSAEAGLKYFILGSLASGLLLYGISMVYGFSGTMDFANIARSPAGPGVAIGLAFVVAGLAFKLSAVPFHMWAPDVYEGAPTPVTAFMSTAPKMAAVALLIRVLFGPFSVLLPQWQSIIIPVAIASMLLGSLAAIGQKNIKRLMAYSSIGHIGYVLVGVAAGTPEGAQGVLTYMVTYIGMSVGAFACIIAMRRHGRAVENISDLSGLARTDPTLALILAILMFSMAGVPPMSGFFGKLFVFQAAVQAGLFKLAIIGVLTSVVGAFYYLRIVKIMYFDDAVEAMDRRACSVSTIAILSGLFTLLFLFIAGPVAEAAQVAARSLLP